MGDHVGQKYISPDQLFQRDKLYCATGIFKRVFDTLFYLALYCISVALGQQQPPRTCINTGLTCIESCAGLADGNYQWCGSCQWFIQCSEGVAYYQPCNANLYWHDDVKACVSVSDTCAECVIHTSPNGLTESTIRMTTIIGRSTQKSNNNIHN